MFRCYTLEGRIALTIQDVLAVCNICGISYLQTGNSEGRIGGPQGVKADKHLMILHYTAHNVKYFFQAAVPLQRGNMFAQLFIRRQQNSGMISVAGLVMAVIKVHGVSLPNQQLLLTTFQRMLSNVCQRIRRSI